MPVELVLEQGDKQHDADSETHSQVLRQESRPSPGLFVVHYFWQHVNERNVDEHAGGDCHDPKLETFVLCNFNA